MIHRGMNEREFREAYRQRRIDLKVQHPYVYWSCVGLAGVYVVLVVSHLIANWLTD